MRKWEPPFLTHVSVSLSVESWILGFLLPILFFSERMASLGCTVLLRMRSEISKLVAISSRLDEVALSICSSRTEVPEENQPAMVEGVQGLLQTEQTTGLCGHRWIVWVRVRTNSYRGHLRGSQRSECNVEKGVGCVMVMGSEASRRVERQRRRSRLSFTGVSSATTAPRLFSFHAFL